MGCAASTDNQVHPALEPQKLSPATAQPQEQNGALVKPAPVAIQLTAAPPPAPRPFLANATHPQLTNSVQPIPDGGDGSEHSQTTPAPLGVAITSAMLFHRGPAASTAVVPRRTKLLCTLGPCSWSEEGLEKLVAAGTNVVCLDFALGMHADHLAVLNRVRMVDAMMGANLAVLMHTRGPTMCTGMLKDHKRVELRVGEEVLVQAGSEFCDFEGGAEKNKPTSLVIAFEALCHSVKPGGRISISNGAIVLEVTSVTNDKFCMARVIKADKKLGEGKRVRLPGALIPFPAIGPAGQADLKKFACKQHVDFIAASYCQTVEDVLQLRRALSEGDSPETRVLAKIENEVGLRHLAEILREADGIIFERASLAQEIPREQLAAAQKLALALARSAGKLAIVSGQLLGSMVSAPFPSLSEAADCTNAVADGADGLLLGEAVAHGNHPAAAVAAAAAALHAADAAMDPDQANPAALGQLSSNRPDMEVVVSCATRAAHQLSCGALLVITSAGESARVAAKFRPAVPVLVVTDSEALVKECQATSGLHAFHVGKVPRSAHGMDSEMEALLARALQYAVEAGLCPPGRTVVLLADAQAPGSPETLPVVSVRIAPGTLQEGSQLQHPRDPGSEVRASQALRVQLVRLFRPLQPGFVRTKVACLLGPHSSSPEALAGLLDAGLDVGCFDMAGGEVAARAALEAFRRAAAKRPRPPGALLMLSARHMRCAPVGVPGGAPAAVEVGQSIRVVGIGPKYASWEQPAESASGHAATNLCVACSSDDVADLVAVGDTITFAEGSVAAQVEEVGSTSGTGPRTLQCRVTRGGLIGRGQRMGLPDGRPPGDAAPLEEQTRAGIQFAAASGFDFVAVPRLQTPQQAREARALLHGAPTLLLARLDSAAGLAGLPGLLPEVDGLVVAREALAVEVGAAPAALALKMVAAQARGKSVVCSGHVMASLADSRMPAASDLADAANCVYDGVDCVLIGPEACGGPGGAQGAVTALRGILQAAEATCDLTSSHSAAPNPSGNGLMPSRVEQLARAAAGASGADSSELIVTVTETGRAARCVSGHRPVVAQVVVTVSESVARQASLMHGQVACHVEQFTGMDELMLVAKAAAKQAGTYTNGGRTIVLCGEAGGNADSAAVMKII